MPGYSFVSIEACALPKRTNAPECRLGLCGTPEGSCHTVGRVWGAHQHKQSPLQRVHASKAFEANPLGAKWMTVRRWTTCAHWTPRAMQRPFAMQSVLAVLAGEAIDDRC